MSLANLRLPVIQAPMFLLSGPEMVIASCRAGIVGSFPAPNARSSEILEAWLQQITTALAEFDNPPPWAINLVMHNTNPRRFDDLALAVKYRGATGYHCTGQPPEKLLKLCTATAVKFMPTSIILALPAKGR